MKEKDKKVIFKIGMIVLAIIGTFVGIALGLFFWPFLLGLFIAVMIEPVVSSLKKNLGIPRSITATIFTVVIYLTLGLLLYVIASKLISELVELAEWIQSNYIVIVENFKISYSKWIEIYLKLPHEITDKVYQETLNSLSGILKVSTVALNKIIGFVLYIPNIIIYIIITFLATLFISSDKKSVKEKLSKQFPIEWINNASKGMYALIATLGNYLRAQLIMITITFVELIIAMSILKVPYAVTMAILIGLFDALPILGAGGILLPWAVYSALTGNIYLAIGLIITYIVVLVVRQLVEPKVVSHNIGIHPLFTLIAMYIGFKIIGLFGLIAGPIIMIILKNVLSEILEKGIFKSVTEDSEE